MTALMKIKKATSGVEIIVYILCFLSLLSALFFNSLSIKIFNVTAILAVLSLLFRFKKIKFNTHSFMLFSSFLLLGIINLTWYSIFKTADSEFRATYHNYLNAAKVFTLGSFIVLLASISKLKINKKIIFYILYSLSFLVFFVSIYIKYNSGVERIDFGIGSATGAAYSISLISIVSSTAILYVTGHNPTFYIINIIVTFISLVLTSTRAAIIIYPLICFIIFLLFYRNRKKELALFSAIFLLILISIGTIFKETIVSRYHIAIQDIVQYKENSESSIGARFAMQKSGISAFQYSPYLGQSVENRALYIKELIKKDSSLSGVYPFLNMHLHNEIIEASSLKGISGIVTTLTLYLSFLFTSYRKKSIPLLGFSLALIGFGLSDVLLWARSIPIIIITGCVIILLYNTKKEDNN